MRPSFPELMQGLFYLALILALLYFTAKAVTGLLYGIDKRQQQGIVQHEKFLAQHDAMMQRLR